MKSHLLHKTISLWVSFCLIFTQFAFAQGVAELNVSEYFRQIHTNVPFGDKLRPPQLRYFSYDTVTDDYRIILDKGAIKEISETDAAEKAKTLLSYFLIGVTLPNDTFWVNLRPDAPDTIIDFELEKTDIGRILLEADLQLKKDTAQCTSPQTPDGKLYWDKLYQKAGELFGSENITIPTLTRPWIVPGEIIVRETDNSAYIYKASLKVLLEEDYLKSSQLSSVSVQQYNFKDERLKELNEYSTQLIRELIIPKLTREVNTSQRYAALRQVFFSLVLSRWFKERFRGKQGAYAKLIDSKNLTNLISQEQWSKNTYFNEYKESFQHGEYNIKEGVATPYGQTIRSYVSGGIELTGAASPLNSNSFRAGEGQKITNTMLTLAGNGKNPSLQFPAVTSSPLGKPEEYNNKTNNIIKEIRDEAYKVHSGLKTIIEALRLKITTEDKAHQDIEAALDNLSSWPGILPESTDIKAMAKEIAKALRILNKYYLRDLKGILEKSGFEEQFSAMILRMEKIIPLKEQIPEALDNFMVKYKSSINQEQFQKVEELRLKERQELENKYDDFIRLCAYMEDLVSQLREHAQEPAKDSLYFDLDEWLSLEFRAQIEMIEIVAVEAVKEIHGKFQEKVNGMERQREELENDIKNIHDKMSAGVLELINRYNDLALPSFMPAGDAAVVSEDAFSLLFLENKDFNHLTQFQFLLLFASYALGNYEITRDKNIQKAFKEKSFAEGLITLYKSVYDLDERTKSFAKEPYTPNYNKALNRILIEMQKRSENLENKISGNLEYAVTNDMPFVRLPFSLRQDKDNDFIRSNLPEAISRLDNYSKELVAGYGKSRDNSMRNHLFLLNVIAVSAKVEMELLMSEINGNAEAASPLRQENQEQDELERIKKEFLPPLGAGRLTFKDAANKIVHEISQVIMEKINSTDENAASKLYREKPSPYSSLKTYLEALGFTINEKVDMQKLQNEIEALIGVIKDYGFAAKLADEIKALDTLSNRLISQGEQFAEELSQLKVTPAYLGSLIKERPVALYYQFAELVKLNDQSYPDNFSLILVPLPHDEGSFLIQLQTPQRSIVNINVYKNGAIKVSRNDILNNLDVRVLAMNIAEALQKGVASSGIQGQPQGDIGGIDFRAMNILTQPMGNLSGLDFSLPVLSRATLEDFDMEKELEQIRNMVKGGIIPSGQRVKEYVAACFQKGQMKEKEDELMFCLLEICMLQEEQVVESSAALRESIVIVDTGRYVLKK